MLGNVVNIVLIFCDDLGTFDMGFNGHPSILTPNIDRMAMEGAVFTDWLSAAPICTPSRASLYTGRLPIRNGLYADMQYLPPGQNISFFGLDAWQRKDGKGGLASSEITFANLVRKQHWDTKLVGKWHLGQSKYEFWPTSHGFSEFVGSLSTHDHGGRPNQYPCTVVVNGTRVVYRLTNGGMPPQGGDDPTRGPHECNVSQVVNGGDGAKPLGVDELMPIYTNECLKFIRAHAKNNPMSANAPFLLVFAPDNTHVPVYASQRFRGTSARGTYGDAVQELDWSVGQILSAIKNGGLDSDTMVILTSDNGAQGGAGNNGCQGMFKCMKGTTWEGGFREPAVIRFPSVVAPMQRITATVSTLDLFPTICELAQVQLPSTLQLDGKSLMPLLRRPHGTRPTSHEPPFRDSYFYWRGNAVFAQRSGAYKLHHYTQGCNNYWEPALQHHNPPLLFHIAHDPAEAFPLNASLPKYQTILATARAQMAAHLSAVENDTTRSRVAQLNICDSAAALWPSSDHPPSNPYPCSYQFPRDVPASREVNQRTSVEVPFALDGCPGGANSSLTRLLFKAVNLSVPGLVKAARAYHNGNVTGACNEVALYFFQAPTAPWLRVAAPNRTSTARVGGQVDAVMLDDTYDFYGELGKVPRRSDGGLDWLDTGPVHDNEFCYALNRHKVWGHFPGFLSAWLQTGNPEYGRAFDSRVNDWTSHNLPAPAPRPHELTVWRTLEAGIRAAGAWADSFFGFQRSAEFRASTRCAMLAGMAEHGRYLRAYGDHGCSNWLSMQYNGLGTLGVVLPELNHATDWIDHAESMVLRDMMAGVYPDGVEDEETSGYHKVALNNFKQFYSTANKGGRAPTPKMSEIIQRMYTYLAYSIDPSGISPLNGDSDCTNNSHYIAAAATAFARTDWLFIVTNGDNGTRPVGPPSRMFEWAGQLVSRSGWERDAHWSWFDVGPFGSSGHGHRDKLHLSVRIGSVPLLVDAGRFSYDGDLAPFRTNYGVRSRAHNVLMLDGQDQVNTPHKARTPLSNASWSIDPRQDRARGTITFDGLQGHANHTRAVVYRRGKWWVVVDRILTDRSRDVEAFWHAHPNCTVTLAGGDGADIVVTRIIDTFSRVGLDVVPASGYAKWNNVTVIKGQKGAELQGWYSPKYGVCVPNSVATYRTPVSSARTSFAWVLVPTKNGVSSGVTARISSESDTHVVVEVVVGGVSTSVSVEM